MTIGSKIGYDGKYCLVYNQWKAYFACSFKVYNDTLGNMIDTMKRSNTNKSIIVSCRDRFKAIYYAQ